MNEIFKKYIPDFTYELINLQDYTGEELIQNQDEISLIMLLNKLQSAEDFKSLPKEGALEALKNTPEYLLEIVAKITTVLMHRLNLPEEEIEEMVCRIKERAMPELFEHFEGYDIQATRREAKLQILVSQICRKLKKHQSPAQIAEALETDETEIARICEVAKKYMPAYDEEKIIAELLSDAVSCKTTDMNSK